MKKTLPCLNVKGPEAMPNFAVLSWQRRRQYTNEINSDEKEKNIQNQSTNQTRLRKFSFRVKARKRKISLLIDRWCLSYAELSPIVTHSYERNNNVHNVQTTIKQKQTNIKKFTLSIKNV